MNIYALSSGRGPSGIAILRVSGKDTLKVCMNLTKLKGIPCISNSEERDSLNIWRESTQIWRESTGVPCKSKGMQCKSDANPHKSKGIPNLYLKIYRIWHTALKI